MFLIAHAPLLFNQLCILFGDLVGISGLENPDSNVLCAYRGEPLSALETRPLTPPNCSLVPKHTSPLLSKTSRDGLNAELNFPIRMNKVTLHYYYFYCRFITH